MTELKGTLPEGKLKMLNKQHKKIIEIEVDLEGGTSIGYFKKPNLQLFSIVMASVTIKPDGSTTINDFEKYTNVLVENCWLGGDEEIKNDEMAAFSVATKLFSLLKPKVSRIKNA